MAGKRRGPQGRWSEEFKRRVVAEAAASELSASEVARQNGINPNLVFSWRKKFGPKVRPATTGNEVCLVPVEVKKEKAPALPVDSCSTGSDFLEITLPCGSWLRCGSGANPALLSQALSALTPHSQSTAQ